MGLDEGATRGWLARALACGGCAVVVLYLLGLLLAGVLGPLRALNQSMTCQGNLMRVTRAIRMYTDDYDDHLPAAEGWMDRVVTYVDSRPRAERRLHCPAVSHPGQPLYGYAMNASLSGIARAHVADPASTPLVYDSTNLARSAVDLVASLPKPGRHTVRGGRGERSRRGVFIGYVGGSVAVKVDASSEAP